LDEGREGLFPMVGMKWWETFSRLHLANLDCELGLHGSEYKMQQVSIPWSECGSMQPWIQGETDKPLTPRNVV